MSSGDSWGRRRGGEFPPRPWSFRYRPRFRRCHRSAAAARLPRSFGSCACLPAISCGGTGRDAAVALPCFLPTYSIIQLWAMGTLTWRHGIRCFVARTHNTTSSTNNHAMRQSTVNSQRKISLVWPAYEIFCTTYGASERNSHHAQSCNLSSSHHQAAQKQRSESTCIGGAQLAEPRANQLAQRR